MKRKGMFSLLFALALCLVIFSQAQAQQVPIELEGPILSVSDNGGGTGVITVMGIVVNIPATATIHSPTATLTVSQLADPTLLPGRSQPGFIGGTAIIIGSSDGITTTAEDIFVEPAENVVVGIITDGSCADADCSAPTDFLEILGASLLRLTDPRIPANAPANAFGFAIDLSQGAPIGSLASVEGYFGQVAVPPNLNPAIHYFILEAEGGVLRNPNIPEVSILRAQCRERDRGIELSVLGAVHTPADAVVEISDTVRGTVFGSVAAIVDAADPVFGSYDFDLSDNLNFLICPDSVTVRVPGAEAVADVDVRRDVAVPPPDQNTAPVFTSNPVLTATVGVPYLYNAAATDLEGGALIFSAVTVPVGMTVSAAGAVDWTPAAGQTGANPVTIRVTDNGGLFADQSFTITVSASPPPVTEVITVTRAEFRTRQGRWESRGNTTLGGSIITARITRTGQIVGTDTAGGNGAWNIRVNGASPAQTPQAGDTLTVSSANGASVTANIRIRN